MIWYDLIWYEMIWYDWYDLTWYGAIWFVIANNVYIVWLNSQNENHQICKWHVFVHASKALYRWYNLCTSHHENIHSRHILQPTYLASICVNIAVRTISNNQSCGVLKTWLARNNLHKLRTRHANWHRIVFLSSTMLILLCWCSTLLHSFSHTLCGVSFLVEV
jgi:hypothetical protein